MIEVLPDVQAILLFAGQGRKWPLQISGPFRPPQAAEQFP
jgi:hypothetical protein